jgi:hypothetical protein
MRTWQFAHVAFFLCAASFSNTDSPPNALSSEGSDQRSEERPHSAGGGAGAAVPPVNRIRPPRVGKSPRTPYVTVRRPRRRPSPFAVEA